MIRCKHGSFSLILPAFELFGSATDLTSTNMSAVQQCSLLSPGFDQRTTFINKESCGNSTESLQSKFETSLPDIVPVVFAQCRTSNARNKVPCWPFFQERSDELRESRLSVLARKLQMLVHGRSNKRALEQYFELYAFQG